MQNLLLTAILLFSTIELSAQNVTKKGDLVIHITGSIVAINDHRFELDISKEGYSLKIKYSYCDSIKFKEVRKDPEFWRLNDKHAEYKAGDPKERSIMDTIGQIIEMHKAYTRDSVTLNLKTDTGYSNLLKRIIYTDKDVLMPKIVSRMLDGYSIYLKIIAEDKNLFTGASNPELKTHPLLFNLITTTLNKNKDSNAVKKIRKYYTEFK